MADIKTRASLRTIKTLDRTQTLAQKTKEGVQGLNREAEQTQSEGYESANEYADDQLESKEKTIARTVTFGAVRLAQKGMKKGRKAIEKRIKNGRKKPDLKVNQPKQLKPPARKALPAPTPVLMHSISGKTSLHLLYSVSSAASITSFLSLLQEHRPATITAAIIMKKLFHNTLTNIAIIFQPLRICHLSH